MASPYDSGEAGRELGQLRAQMGAINKRLEALLANDQKRQSADRAAGKPLATREGDARAARRAYAGRDAETATASTSAFSARTRQTQITDSLTESEKRLARAQAESTGALRTNIQQGYASSQELRRRGALTTEAIAAAGRGTLTFRELGFQVGATIGKFAGWTLAAGFTFAAIDAVTKLGQGALEGAEGVNKLSRVVNNVDTSRAHDQIRSLAESANQDLGTVGDALFESGKVFNNQDDAEKLTRVALRAKNIGELEVGDSVRFLTSIVRGFKLEAGDASQVLDIFNNLQQKFGTDIRGGLQGGAQAAAQVLNSGGNLRQLAALTATMQRAGFSGSEAGVAIRRSTELTKRPGSINKERLAEFGIDSDLPFAQIIERAVELAESGKLTGPQINQLATALVTPQLSPRFAAVLNRPDQYRRAFEIAGPSSKDSAVKEERKFLDTPTAKLKAIGVELEKLGDALGESGAFKILGLMASALEGSLEAATRLVDVFNELPAPLRQALLVMGEIYAVTRLIRRFNPGDGVTVGRFPTANHPTGYFQPTPDSRLRKFLRGDARNEVQYFRDTQEQAARRQTDTRFRQGIAVAQQREVRTRDLAAARGGDEAAARRVLAADRAAISATNAATAAKIEYTAANSGLTSAIARQTQVDKLLRNRANPAQNVALATGFTTISTSQDVPTHLQPGTVSPGGVFIPAGQGKPERTPVASATKETLAKSREARTALTNAAKEGRAVAVAGRTIIPAQSLFGRSIAIVGASADQVKQSAANASQRIRGARSGIAGAAAGLGRMGSSLASFFGPLEALIIGLFALQEIVSHNNQMGDLRDELEKRKGKLSSRDAQGLLDQAEQPRGPFAFLGDKARQYPALALAPGPVGIGATALGAGLGLAGIDTPFINDDPTDSLRDDLKDEADAAKKRERKRKEKERELARLRAQQRAGHRAPSFSPVLFDDTQLQGEIDALNTLSEIGQLGPRGLRDLTDAYFEAVRRFSGSRNPEDIQKLAAAQQAFQGVLEGIQQNFERQLELADTPGERRAAYDDARQKALAVRRRARVDVEKARRQVRTTQEEERKARQEQKRYRESQAGPLLGGSDIGNLPSGDVAENRLKKNRDLAKKKLNKAQRALKLINDFLREFFHNLAEAFKGSQDDQFAKFDEQTDLIRQRADVAASGTLNTGAQLAARLNAANQNLSRARSLGSGPEAERRINDAIIERNNIVNEMANLAVQRLEAANQIKIASAPTEQARIRAEIGAAQAKLALLRSQGRGSEETDTVVADIIRLQKELQQQILEDAKSLAEAVAEYRKSKTANPNREADIDVGLARRLLRLDRRIEDPTERRRAILQDRARLNDARGQRRLTGVSERFETIEYKARIGLISGGQELNLIQTLLNSISKKQLRTIDGMRDFYRQLKERMKQLEKESELEINPGSIRLPTLYDVRRLQQQGTNQAAAGVVTQQNVYTFDVGDVSAAEALGGVLERIHGSDTTAAMRAAGMI